MGQMNRQADKMNVGDVLQVLLGSIGRILRELGITELKFTASQDFLLKESLKDQVFFGTPPFVKMQKNDWEASSCKVRVYEGQDCFVRISADFVPYTPLSSFLHKPIVC